MGWRGECDRNKGDGKGGKDTPPSPFNAFHMPGHKNAIKDTRANCTLGVLYFVNKLSGCRGGRTKLDIEGGYEEPSVSTLSSLAVLRLLLILEDSFSREAEGMGEKEGGLEDPSLLGTMELELESLGSFAAGGESSSNVEEALEGTFTGWRGLVLVCGEGAW